MSDILNRLFVSVKKIITANLPFVILIAILFGYLAVRALPENRWNGWKCCSTQVLLTARFWARDGFFNHYLLGLNQGYGKIIRYFDEPELQHHAHGAVASNLLAQKLYYTHYPVFYIAPLALMMKLGIDSLFIFKLLAIITSLAGLAFFYAFIKSISNKFIAFIATLYFVVSPVFIGNADILEYLPMEDVLGFSIMFLSIFFLNRLKLKKFAYYKTYFAVIWVFSFLLSLVSYNSNIFIFTWLAGLTAIYFWRENIFHKKIIFIFLIALWASAPILGFAIHLIQNAAYLGWSDMWLDIYGTYISAGNSVRLDLLTRTEGMIRPFFSITGIYNFYTLMAPYGLSKIKQIFLPNSIPLVYIFSFLIIFTIAIIVKIRKKLNGLHWPPLSIMLLLLAAPLSQTFFLPFVGYRDYMGRLTAPFVGIVIGSVAYNAFLLLKEQNYLTLTKRFFLFTALVIVALLFIIQITLSLVNPLPTSLSNSEIRFTQYVKNITAGEKAVFMIDKKDISVDDKELEMRKAYISSFNYFIGDYLIWAYYFDMPLLNFIKTDYLVKDLLFLEKRAEFPFTVIVTSDNKVLIDEIYQKLRANQLPLKPVEIIENRYLFIVSPSIP
ncbi:hypothetical protein A2819_00315 [Candidatus Azambacteria bacterium RIFCSPHIGHO2_01_FULL_40_24]|uniref:Glycosyltransferase RgtA/B/C/D-like domain-containing protein n=1 Tax=Candidatus Azambacteria bacterium RIFCSPHIGHO2_01_FULL_40_24 TaxID=1797301 RepID=A0A1F5B3W6_9BACT|nr:MAG: hypothetical protein A2819_00315 [Candidatus Azambacteria bacterium RIFCSPHIGHO2_01_FULL_40_24]